MLLLLVLLLEERAKGSPVYMTRPSCSCRFLCMKLFQLMVWLSQLVL